MRINSCWHPYRFQFNFAEVQLRAGFTVFRCGVARVSFLFGYDVTSLGSWFQKFRDNVVVSPSRIETPKSPLKHLRPWGWEYNDVSKSRELINQWRGFASRKKGYFERSVLFDTVPETESRTCLRVYLLRSLNSHYLAVTRQRNYYQEVLLKIQEATSIWIVTSSSLFSSLPHSLSVWSFLAGCVRY